MKSVKAWYFAAAGALGCLWFLALLIPRSTREQLLPAFPYHAHGPGFIQMFLSQLVLMCLASLMLAAVFKRAIVNTESVWLGSVLALALPFAGAEVWILMKMGLGLMAGMSADQRSYLLQSLAAQLVLAPPVAAHYAFYVIIPMGFVSQYVLNRTGGSGVRRLNRIFRLVMLAVVFLSLGCMAWIKQVDGRRTIAHEMTWGYGSPPTQCPGAKYILFRFVKYPRQVIGICSRDLGEYLESLPDNKVSMTFEVWYDLRSISGFREVKIGELTHWNDEWSNYQSEGDSGRSPWEP